MLAIAVPMQLAVGQTAATYKNLVVLTEDDKADLPESDFWLGLRIGALPDVAKRQLAVDDGVVVEEVLADSPASKAELKRHDILIKAGDTLLKEPADLVKAVENAKEKTVNLTIVRS